MRHKGVSRQQRLQDYIEGICPQASQRGGADDTASGATRVAGSLNFRDKYAPDFPRVQVAHTAPGQMASPSQLERMGLVAEPEKTAPPVFRLSSMERTRTGRWPSYLRCVQGAPQNRDQTGPDISRADFT